MSESAVGHDRYDLKIFVRGKQPNNEGWDNNIWMR